MSLQIECHPTAVVLDGAELGVGVKLGPYAIVHPTARIGDGSDIGAFAVVHDHTCLGRETRVFPHACVGSEPQDLKFDGELSFLDCGERNTFREFVTVNRGTEGGGGVTRIGSDNMFMAYVHIAHDCQIGDHTIFGNSATLAGHVEIGDHTILNAFAGVQQFARVGEHAYLSAFAGITKDIVPFARANGNHAHILGLNSVGLQRRGFNSDTRRALKTAFRTLFREKLNTTQALAKISSMELGGPEIDRLVSFVESSELGITK
jgi:UDP-N-acetylglucosamine acyltransferase